MEKSFLADTIARVTLMVDASHHGQIGDQITLQAVLEIEPGAVQGASALIVVRSQAAKHVWLENKQAPASDVARLGAVSRAPKIPGENPLPLPRRQKKGPLNTWEIEGRAFSARMLPAGQSVHGFFYFQTVYKPGSRLYLNGIKDPASGKDYFYFEVPILRP